MKKICVLLFALLFLLSLVACDAQRVSNIQCDNCGEQNALEARFCQSCGKLLTTSKVDKDTNGDTSNKTDGTNSSTDSTVHNHSFNSKTTAPTCTTEGYTTFTCSCGETYRDDYIDATGHKWLEPTCTTPKKCSLCGRTDGTALNHSYENGKCKRCQEPDPIYTAISNLNNRVKIYGTHIYLNSADGVSIYIEWENVYYKEIKYIYFQAELYNRVGDVLSCDISDKEAQWLSQTGPIPKGKGMYSSAGGVSSSSGAKRPFRPDVSYSEYKEDDENGWADRYWDCIWYNSQAYYVKIVGVEIEYMDGTTYTETNRNVFDQLDIVNLNINQDSYEYVWVYPTSAQLVAKNLPYSSDDVYIESLIIDSVEGIEEDTALFVCRFKGYCYDWGVELSMKVVDQYGNRVDDYISSSVIITEEGNFTSSEFYVTTPIDGTYYLVIEYDY